MAGNFSIYTLEDIDVYGRRLFINTGAAAALNALAAYLVLKHSTGAMGNLKYYILSTIIFGFLLDFQITFIFGPFPLFPRAIMCPAGIARYFGPFWGMTMQYVSFSGIVCVFFGF